MQSIQKQTFFLISVTFSVFFLSGLLSNILFISDFLGNVESFTAVQSLAIFFSIVFSSYSDVFQLILSLLLSFFFALNLLFLVRNEGWKSFRNHPLGVLGIASGVLGLGCAACSTLLTAQLISLFGLTFVSATLPFQSTLFQIIGILLLLLSLYFMIQKDNLRVSSSLSSFQKSKKGSKYLFLFFFLLLLTVVSIYREKIGLYLIERGELIPIVEILGAKNSEVLFALGNHYFNPRHYNIDRAQDNFQDTIAQDMRYPGAHYQLSRIYFIENKLPDALNEINKELAYHPDFKRSYYVRGLIYGYMKMHDLAVQDFEEFLQYSPRSWAGHNDLAWAYFSQGKYEETLSVADKGLDIHPSNVWLLNSRGVALLNLDKREEARETFQKALTIASRMNPSEWGEAYPGNNPEFYGQGLTAMQKSIQNNLTLLNLDEK